MINKNYISKQLDYYFSTANPDAQYDALYRIGSHAQCEIGLGELEPDYLSNEQIEQVKDWVWNEFGEKL